MLYLVPTPIGNLEDISYRAVKILGQVDYILCEDTRHTKKLLDAFEITTPLQSFHKFSEKQKESHLISDLKQNKQIALCSDAGTPCINDPGQFLVRQCHEQGIEVTALPGPCAVTVAFSVSGVSDSHFAFLGFFPKKEKEQLNTLLHIFFNPLASILYEAPHRLLETLEMLARYLPKRRVFVARELSKKYESFYHGSCQEVYANMKNDATIKGEFVLVIESDPTAWEIKTCTPLEQMEQLQKDFDISKNEAIKIVAQLQNIDKKTLYKQAHT